MKKIVTLLFLVCFIVTDTFSQDSAATRPYIRKPALGLSFFFNDFLTAQRIRSSSLSSVLANKQRAKINEMDPGIALTYFKGLSNHVDLAVSMAGSFTQYDLEDRFVSDEKFFLETDASINIKLMTEKYWVTPYASIGAGISKYGTYYGAFIPVGIGLKLNILDEAHVFYNSQYRIPVTTGTANYHFMHGIGIAGIISSK
jgi:hypothetical protein